MKRLLVVADDFGLTPGVNRGIVRAFTEGILTSASLLTNTRHFEEALSASRSLPDLKVGIHLALVGGRPLLPAAEVPSLAPRGGAFRRSWRGFLPAWLAGRVREEEVRAEWRAQIARAVEAGVRPSHLDSHQHLHALPRLFTIARDLAGEFGVPRIRSLREPGPGLAGTPLRRKLILRGLSRLSAAAAGDSGDSCDRIFGVAEAGRLDLPALLSVLRRVPEGRTELVTHPGLLDPELSREYRWDYRWEEELRALCSTEVAAEVARLGITLDRAS